MLKDPTGRVHFLHEDDEVLYTVEAENLLDTFYSIGELQDAISSLSLRDPMAQLTALSVITNSPYIFEEPPLSGQILDEFTEIFLYSNTSSVVHGACDALVTCTHSISPVTCIQYLQMLLEAILKRLSAEEECSKNEDACTIILMLISACESLFCHVCSNVYSVLSNFSGLHGLGNLTGVFFHKALNIYNCHFQEMQVYLSKSSSVIIANTPFNSVPTDRLCLQYLILLDSTMEYADLWMKRIAALPYASEGAQDYFLQDTVAESIAMAIAPSQNHICADVVADILVQPCIIAQVNSNSFNRHLLELSPRSVTKRVLTSRYMANIFLRLIYRDGLYKLPKFHIVTLACCGVLGPFSLHFCEALHPLDLLSLLRCIVDETSPAECSSETSLSKPQLLSSSSPAISKKSSALTKNKQPVFNTSTKIDYKNLEITARTTLPPLSTQLKLVTKQPKARTMFVAGQEHRQQVIASTENNYFIRNQTDRELKLDGTRKLCEKITNLMANLKGKSACSNDISVNRSKAQSSQAQDSKISSLDYLVIDLFLTVFARYSNFNPNTAQAVIGGLLCQYSNIQKAPLTLCRILGSRCFASCLEKRVATIVLRKTVDATIAMLSRGVLSSSSCMLQTAITVKFAGIQPHAKTMVELPAQSSDILRQILALQISRNAIQRSGVLCMTLLNEFAEEGIDQTLFLTNNYYQTYVFNPAKISASSLDGQVLDFPDELLHWLQVDGTSFEAWINTQQNRHIVLAKMLSVVTTSEH
ncbi:Hypothetical protein DHA2_16247 [Giardia duodenalis]|uniref:Uncharacterized protein n=1 Tax=Giardia intestinalis TaxID=5741 RepID=V6TBI2_GIAIN|nr:Hypothetical protein DHA2_16247 [Giardia intestinalis]